MVEDFDEIVNTVKETINKNINPEVLRVYDDEPHIIISTDQPVSTSRLEFIDNVSKDVIEEFDTITFNFIEASNSKVNGTSTVNYRIKVEELENHNINKKTK